MIHRGPEPFPSFDQNRIKDQHEEEEFVFPFVVQAAATSARVPRTGIVVPQAHGVWAGACLQPGVVLFLSLATSVGRAGVRWLLLSFFKMCLAKFRRFLSVSLSFSALVEWGGWALPQCGWGGGVGFLFLPVYFLT